VRKRRKKRGTGRKKPKKRIRNRGTPYKSRYRNVITAMYNTVKEKVMKNRKRYRAAKKNRTP